MACRLPGAALVALQGVKKRSRAIRCGICTARRLAAVVTAAAAVGSTFGCVGRVAPAPARLVDTAASSALIFQNPDVDAAMRHAPEMLGLAAAQHYRRDALLGVTTDAERYTDRWFPGLPGPGGAQPDYSAYVQDRLTRTRNGYTYRYSRITSRGRHHHLYRRY